MRWFGLIVFCVAISGCAMSEITVPVTGKLSDGRAVSGAATARMSGEGTFSVTLPEGMSCSGNYDAMKADPNFTVPVTCGDGRKGEAVVARRPGGMSGTAIVTLDDGTVGRFVFGSLKYEQAFNEIAPAPTPQ